MSSETPPTPERGRLSALGASLLLYTGPLAWFIQICAGEMMTSWPCFPSTDRLDAPVPGYAWARAGALVILLLCAVTAGAAGYFAWRKYAEVRARTDGEYERTCFVALWGLYLGLGFALATLVTLAAFAMVPSCLG